LTFAQNSISGIVTDSNNLPIPGANIKIIGDSAGTTTDVDGSFYFEILEPPYTIEVTSVGFASQRAVASPNQKNQ
jgi:hypothetical protein